MKVVVATQVIDSHSDWTKRSRNECCKSEENISWNNLFLLLNYYTNHCTYIKFIKFTH